MIIFDGHWKQASDEFGNQRPVPTPARVGLSEQASPAETVLDPKDSQQPNAFCLYLLFVNYRYYLFVLKYL